MDSGRLKNKVDVYKKISFVNELGEEDYKYDSNFSIWVEIVPTSGSVQQSQGNTTFTDTGYKFTIRANSIPDLSNDMYFMFKNQRYNIKYLNPNYKFRDSIEIFCSLVV
jgi:SPP1 family predicted phage head-tail adaptor